MAKIDQVLVNGTTYEIVPEIAPLFSESTAYTVGDCVIKDAVLYRFTAAHAAGAWIGTDAEVITVGDELNVLKTDLTLLDSDFYGEDVSDFSNILSNDNTAVTSNNDGTYSVGTNDYGTTVFAEQLSLSPGKYLLSGASTGYMFVATTTNVNDKFVMAKTTPVEFEIYETTNCYLGFRMDSRAVTATTITPYIKTIETKRTIESIKGIVDSEKSTVDLTSQFVIGGYIATNEAIGTAITFTPTLNTGYAYNVQPCKESESFTVDGYGGANSLLWTFVDSDFKVVSKSDSNINSSGIVLIAPTNGYLIVNANLAYGKSLVKTSLSNVVDYQRITNPHKLFWKMGTFNKNGEQGGTFTDRMFTTCKVKAGSTILAPTTGGVNISFGYKVDEASTELDYFQSYNYGAVGIAQDCTIYVGVIFNTPAFIPNDSLLNNLTFDLIVEDYENKYSKKDSCVFGNPVDVYYEGQHTDETGWTNATVDIDAIHTAFDALVTASNGYITKTDLGVAYDTYHAYQYSTVPAGLHISGGLKLPKVAILCCMHGNEKMSAYAMHYLMYDLVHNSTKNPVLSYLRTNCQIVFVPITNPWGFLNTSRWNENGVNLNRNFPTYNWDDYDDETSVIGGINYKGTAPASEDQTKLMIAFLRKNYDAVFAIDLHTNGTNTSAWYEICTAIIPLDADATSKNYEVQSSYVNPSKVHINRIKPWFDEKYGTDLGNVFYGNVSAPEADRPTASQWIRESNNMVAFTFEVLCGSSDNYLGAMLTKYSPATIKAAAEELGNFLVAMLINCKDV